VFVVAMDVVRGSSREVLPPIVDGRAPAAPQEIALAGHTMRRLGLGIGDRAELAAEEGARPLPVTVVGRVVMPPVLGTVEPGEGALMPNGSTYDALGVDPSTGIPRGKIVFLRLAPGASPAEVLADLNKGLGGSYEQMYEVPRVEPRDLVDFGRVDGFPLLLGGVLALLAASTLVHVLVSSVRQRRHDFATLRSLGLRRGQVRAVVACQAAFLVACAVAIGVPLGALAGNVAWSLYADRSGFISAVRVPAIAVLLVVVLSLLVGLLCALFPAQAAARTPPARLLRAE
jgi:hypothetical protein